LGPLRELLDVLASEAMDVLISFSGVDVMVDNGGVYHWLLDRLWASRSCGFKIAFSKVSRQSHIKPLTFTFPSLLRRLLGVLSLLLLLLMLGEWPKLGLHMVAWAK